LTFKDIIANENKKPVSSPPYAPNSPAVRTPSKIKATEQNRGF
jgi:hypothetical protein